MRRLAEHERYAAFLRGIARRRTNWLRSLEGGCVPQRRHGSSSKISTETNAVIGIATRRSLRLFTPNSSSKGAAGQDGSFRVDRNRRLARRGPDHRGRDRGVRGLVRRPVRRIFFDPPLTPLVWEIAMRVPLLAALQ